MLTLLVFIIIASIGVFGIVLSIDFFDHLKKYRPKQWELLTYERPFGIPRQDFLLHPIKPHKFIVSIFSSEKVHDDDIASYKIKLKIVILSFVFLCVVLIVIP
jgi:hypothetical protein